MESSNASPAPSLASDEPDDFAEPATPVAGLILLESADDAGACSADGWCD
ncbi:hypothetical protein ACFY36_44500 [Actinoplanes sp. NPDC000266]